MDLDTEKVEGGLERREKQVRDSILKVFDEIIEKKEELSNEEVCEIIKFDIEDMNILQKCICVMDSVNACWDVEWPEIKEYIMDEIAMKLCRKFNAKTLQMITMKKERLCVRRLELEKMEMVVKTLNLMDSKWWVMMGGTVQRIKFDIRRICNFPLV